MNVDLIQRELRQITRTAQEIRVQIRLLGDDPDADSLAETVLQNSLAILTDRYNALQRKLERAEERDRQSRVDVKMLLKSLKDKR